MTRVSISGVLAVAVLATGCVEKESLDPGAIVREETVDRVGPPSRATSRVVRCGCDADGDLHVRAPQGSHVVRPEEDGTYEAEAEILLPDDPPPAPLRRTKSLGFIGDSKLGESRIRGGPWAAPDALLPPHAHVEPRYGAAPSYGLGGYGARVMPPYGAAWSTPSPPMRTSPAAGSWSGSSPHGAPPIGPGWR